MLPSSSATSSQLRGLRVGPSAHRRARWCGGAGRGRPAAVGAVVQVAFDPAAGGVAGGDDPGAGGDEFGVELTSSRETASWPATSVTASSRSPVNALRRSRFSSSSTARRVPRRGLARPAASSSRRRRGRGRGRSGHRRWRRYDQRLAGALDVAQHRKRHGGFVPAANRHGAGRCGPQRVPPRAVGPARLGRCTSTREVHLLGNGGPARRRVIERALVMIGASRCDWRRRHAHP